MTNQEMVHEMHEVYGLAIGEYDRRVVDLRMKLLEEEAGEAIEAMYEGDLPHIAKELADVLYVTYGAAVTYGIDLDKVFAEVHRSNMSKLGEDGNPIRREDGKILKGPNYFEPDIKALLEN